MLAQGFLFISSASHPDGVGVLTLSREKGAWRARFRALAENNTVLVSPLCRRADEAVRRLPFGFFTFRSADTRAVGRALAGLPEVPQPALGRKGLPIEASRVLAEAAKKLGEVGLFSHQERRGR